MRPKGDGPPSTVPRLWLLVWIVVGALILFLGNGIWYWSSQHELGRIDYCLYENAACSVAVATYAAAVFGAIAFLIAASAFNNERTPRLTIEYCSRKNEMTASPPIELGLNRVEKDFESRESGMIWNKMRPSRVLDVSNVGRAPAINCGFQMRCVSADAVEKLVWVNVGTVSPAETIHLRLYVSQEFDQHIFSWTGKTRHFGGGGSAAFHPRMRRVEFTRVYKMAQGIKAGRRQKPIPKKPPD